jgi:hypothetical protein
MSLRAQFKLLNVGDREITIGVYSPLPGVPRITFGGAPLPVIYYHDMFRAEEPSLRRSRKYENLVTPEIDRILTAKDTFFDRSSVCIIVAKHFPDLQMVIGAVNRLTKGAILQAHIFLDERLSKAFNEGSIREAGTTVEKRQFDLLRASEQMTFETFKVDSEIGSICLS